MKLNETPVRTSNNYGINEMEIKNLEILKKIEEFDGLTITGDISNFEISHLPSKIPLVYGTGKELEKQVYENANQELKILANNSGNLNIEFDFDEENYQLIENIEIVAKQKSNVTVIIKYISNNENRSFHNGIIRVTAQENSTINVIIINMLNNKSNNFLSMENYLEKFSNINYTIIDLGGNNSVTNYYSNLVGQESKINLNTIYLGSQEQLFDINYIAELKGERTDANIEVQGALKDTAKKNFKGTIDFKKGSKKATGSENEFCMLLSDDARSKALPMLLCTEEDVEGNHSTAAGKVEDEMLFYIMSRGLSYKEAMKLIVKAKFNAILDTIKDEDLKNEIINEIDKRLD